jgi:AraC-like DNA-binding protein
MRTLDTITNWPERGREAAYNWKRMAARCGVAPRTMHEFFQANFFFPPQQWLDHLRIFDAMERLSRGASVKQAAFELGFKHVSNFCRAFKVLTGDTPLAFALASQRESKRVMNEVSAFFFPEAVPNEWLPVPFWTESRLLLELKAARDCRLVPFTVPGRDCKEGKIRIQR